MFLLNKYNEFFLKMKELKKEVKNITWPDKKDINQTILTVAVSILFTSLCLWIIDSLLIYLISKMT